MEHNFQASRNDREMSDTATPGGSHSSHVDDIDMENDCPQNSLLVNLSPVRVNFRSMHGTEIYQKSFSAFKNRKLTSTNVVPPYELVKPQRTECDLLTRACMNRLNCMPLSEASRYPLAKDSVYSDMDDSVMASPNAKRQKLSPTSQLWRGFPEETSGNAVLSTPSPNQKRMHTVGAQNSSQNSVVGNTARKMSEQLLRSPKKQPVRYTAVSSHAPSFFLSTDNTDGPECVQKCEINLLSEGMYD